MEFVVKSARRQARRLFLLPSDGERVASRKETAGEANSVVEAVLVRGVVFLALLSTFGPLLL